MIDYIQLLSKKSGDGVCDDETSIHEIKQEVLRKFNLKASCVLIVYDETVGVISFRFEVKESPNDD